MEKKIRYKQSNGDCAVKYSIQSGNDIVSLETGLRLGFYWAYLSTSNKEMAMSLGMKTKAYILLMKKEFGGHPFFPKWTSSYKLIEFRTKEDGLLALKWIKNELNKRITIW